MRRNVLTLALVSLGLLNLAPAHAAGLQLMSPERLAWYRARLPVTSDPELNAVLSDPALILYTTHEMPPAFQAWSDVLAGVHSPDYDLSGGVDHVGRGSGHEFPWEKPAGTDNIEKLVTFKGVRLSGPITVRRAPQDHPRSFFVQGQHTKVEWTFPVGTVFIEVLAHPDGTPFELRVKTRDSNGWDAEVFRPFVRAADLPGSPAEPDVRRARLQSSHPDRSDVNVSGLIELLPEMDRTALLKDRVFLPATGVLWRDGTDIVAAAGGPWPEDYVPVMSVDRFSCMDCHRSTNQNVGHFHVRRDWYGNVRGSDGILSFHPFDPQHISRDGANRPVRYRRELLDAGLLKFDGDSGPVAQPAPRTRDANPAAASRPAPRGATVSTLATAATKSEPSDVKTVPATATGSQARAATATATALASHESRTAEQRTIIRGQSADRQSASSPAGRAATETAAAGIPAELPADESGWTAVLRPDTTISGQYAPPIPAWRHPPR